MKYAAKPGKLSTLKSACLLLPLAQAKALAKDLQQEALLQAQLQDFEDSAGKLAQINLPAACPIRRLLVLGGCHAGTQAADLRKIMQAAANALKTLAVSSAHLSLEAVHAKDLDSNLALQQSLALFSQTLYWYEPYKSDVKPQTRISQLNLVFGNGRKVASSKALTEICAQASALAAGLGLARDLGNCPPNVCTPSYLAQQARTLAKTSTKTSIRVLDEPAMKKLGMGAFLAVSQGSDNPGRLIVLEYQGAPARGKSKAAPIVLVGKGITFDTGGISLKPPAAMDEMKFDMCGAASVLGVTKAVIAAKLPIHLVTIVAAAENMPSGSATRPGDIVTSLSGQTIEVLNTDAEGRMVLCDAMTYAQQHYQPKTLIDVATLTGACIVALGAHASGLFANDDGLSQALVHAGEQIWDRAWPMPVWEDYQSQLKSNFADMANVGGRDAGAVTAACFLARYAKNVAWAHLDIAGSAFTSGASKGATGRPVPLLFQYLLQQCQ